MQHRFQFWSSTVPESPCALLIFRGGRTSLTRDGFLQSSKDMLCSSIMTPKDTLRTLSSHDSALFLFLSFRCKRLLPLFFCRPSSQTK